MSTFTSKQDPTLCWDCANATGNCRWSKKLKPIKGWKVSRTEKETSEGTVIGYTVRECPEFIRDAYGHGVHRYIPQEQA